MLWVLYLSVDSSGVNISGIEIDTTCDESTQCYLIHIGINTAWCCCYWTAWVHLCLFSQWKRCGRGLIIILPRMLCCRLMFRIVCLKIYVSACTLIVKLILYYTTINNLHFSNLIQSVSGWIYCTCYWDGCSSSHGLGRVVCEVLHPSCHSECRLWLVINTFQYTPSGMILIWITNHFINQLVVACMSDVAHEPSFSDQNIEDI